MSTKTLMIILVLAGPVLYAQVPGYMGKRWVILLDGNATPALFNQNSNNAVSVDIGDMGRARKSNILAFNVRPQATIEFLIHRDFSLGLSYSMIRTGTIRAYEEGIELPNDYEHLKDPDVVRGNAVGLHFKFYPFNRTGLVAPIGFYQTFGVYMTKTNTYDDKKATSKQFKNDFLYPVINYGIGKQVIISNRFFIRSGIEFGWACVPMNYIIDANNEWSIQEESGYNVHGSLLGYYLFNINIALGIIAF